MKFRSPLDDSRVLASLVSEAASSVFRSGVEFTKAGVCLMGIARMGLWLRGVFGQPSAVSSDVMSTVDGINGRFGRGPLRLPANSREPFAG